MNPIFDRDLIDPTVRTSLSDRLSLDRIVWHEAAHAIVGHRLGMTVQFIDMTGLLIPSPLCGLDVDPVPVAGRPRITGITALAGPVGEVLGTDHQPLWRTDGEVARAQAKALTQDMSEQMNLLIEWSRFAQHLLETDAAYRPLVKYLDRKRTITRDEFLTFVQTTDRVEAKRA